MICNCAKLAKRIGYGTASCVPADTLRDWIFGPPLQPFRAKGFIPPRNAFTRSLAYHASGGARRVESSANNNPFWPVGWLLSVLHTPSQHPVLQFAFGLPPHGPFICPSNDRTAQSVPPLGTPFFSSFSSPSLTPTLLLCTCPVTSPITEIS